MGRRSATAGPRTAAWIFYCTGLTLSAAAVGLGFADVDGAAETAGGWAIITMTGALILMQVDGTLNRNKLNEELEEVALAPGRIRPRLASIGPWVSPGRRGEGFSAGLGVSGGW